MGLWLAGWRCARLKETEPRALITRAGGVGGGVGSQAGGFGGGVGSQASGFGGGAPGDPGGSLEGMGDGISVLAYGAGWGLIGGCALPRAPITEPLQLARVGSKSR